MTHSLEETPIQTGATKIVQSVKVAMIEMEQLHILPVWLCILAELRFSPGTTFLKPSDYQKGPVNTLLTGYI
jgi:hypothetical protein